MAAYETLADVVQWLRKLQAQVADLAVGASANAGFSGQLTAGALASPPPGWLLCDGTAVSRTTYQRLFDAIGTTYGVGNGSTTFNVPDLLGRVPIGAGTGSGLTARTLGAKVGTEPSNMPSHNHGGTTGDDSPDHAHNVANTINYSLAPTFALGGQGIGQATIASGGANSRHQHTIPAQGGGADNVPPAQAVNWFIRT